MRVLSAAAMKAATLFVAAITMGCATAPASRPISAESREALRGLDVLVVIPGIDNALGTPNTNQPQGPFVPGISAPGLTPSQAASGAGVVGTVVAMSIIDLIVGGDVAKQRLESKELLQNNAKAFAPSYLRSVVAQKLESQSRVQASIPIAGIRYVADSAAKPQTLNQAALVLDLRQSFSADLLKVRMKMQAVVTDAKGEEVMKEVYYFLPATIAGVDKEAAIRNWVADDAKLYKEQVAMGVDAMFDALDLTLFSKGRTDAMRVPTSATSLLRRTNCYGGDYDVGIPMSSYEEGTLLALREKHAVVRLKDGLLLTFPACSS
ncbi:MAG: hypothetical protein KF871_04705 [Hydrogenophaga sp.]|uniref:hypothetical protein n=1 Tax=Hydrogenophaga sp. TaxID=1904254 RepID=UPI001DB87749|nr:hypothetical protein [Hydrogenophaga sp.]MBX3609176.1 hypothetical protein [Hydrogenophaga sp.]